MSESAPQIPRFGRTTGAIRTVPPETPGFWRLHQTAERWSPAVHVTIVAGLLAAVAALDFTTGPEISVSYFFWFPIWWAAWFIGRWSGIASALVAAAAWHLVREVQALAPSQPWIAYWNTAMRLAFFASFAFIVSYLRDTLPALHAALLREHSLARRDPLTGTFNARALREIAQHELWRLHRYGRTLVVAFVDIDDFKAVNDRLGHAAGDATLRSFANTLMHRLRRTDVIGRVGGDEFVVILPETDHDEAIHVLEKLRDEIAEIVTDSGGGLAVSVGALVLSPGFRGDVDDMIGQADALMYRVKRSGKNSILIESAESAESAESQGAGQRR